MKTRIYIYIAASLLFVVAAAAYISFMPRMSGVNGVENPYLIYIDADDTADSVCEKSGMGWRWSLYSGFMRYKVRTGCYRIEPDRQALMTYRMLRNGIQTPVMVPVPSVRTMEMLASRLSSRLMLDSAQIATALYDESFCQQYGLDVATMPSLFIPDSYEMYWDITLEALMKRMQKENTRFWTKERLGKASGMNLTKEEVSTLASIVEEETANDAEKPTIAGLYLNRLHKHIPLQADPTVKFALGDFSLRRIYNEHLRVDNPYNTYRNLGLPPGPIRIPSKVGLDAVLNYQKHDYIYMCAKEDFSGTHNYAVSYAEHLRNAARYVKALNARNIK